MGTESMFWPLVIVVVTAVVCPSSGCSFLKRCASSQAIHATILEIALSPSWGHGGMSGPARGRYRHAQ